MRPRSNVVVLRTVDGRYEMEKEGIVICLKFIGSLTKFAHFFYIPIYIYEQYVMRGCSLVLRINYEKRVCGERRETRAPSLFYKTIFHARVRQAFD